MSGLYAPKTRRSFKWNLMLNQNHKVAQDLRDVRRLCKLGPLALDELHDYWVNTDKARDPHNSLRKNIKNKLEDEEQDLQILVYGHGGTGKSTELAKLVEELGSSYFTVRFSVQEELNFADIVPQDILVVLVEEVLQKAQEANLSVKEDTLNAVYDWFAKETDTSTEAKQSEIGIQAEAGLGNSILIPFVKFMAALKSDIKLSTKRETSRVQEIRKRPGELVTNVNLLLNAVRHALSGQRLLIIVEDMDKLDIASARTVFIENVNLLTGIHATIIYTIPIFTFHSPDASILRSKFGSCISLPMIKVLESNGDHAEGFRTVQEIIRRRIPKAILTETALTLLIEKTGGVLQHVFEVLHTAASMSDAVEPLTEENIQYGLQRKRREFFSEITIPYGGVPGQEIKVQDLYDRLAEYAKVELRGEKNPPLSDALNQLLLRCCALVEYNGKSWFGVHPLVFENLKELALI